MSDATGWDRSRLVAESGAGVPAAAARRFGEMVRRRLRREPVAYILGRKGFRALDLAVDRRVLIPRPETELLVELALERRPRRVLDVGTGSGAIALAIADELPECEVIATDTSGEALEVARANAERLGLADRVEFFEAMLPPAVLKSAGPPRGGGSLQGEGLPFDLIVANLPYIAESEWRGLEPEVTEWEPREALLAGADGLDAIRELLDHCARGSAGTAVGSSSGAIETRMVALEVGARQAETVGELICEAGFATVETRQDLAGIPRVVWGRR